MTIIKSIAIVAALSLAAACTASTASAQGSGDRFVGTGGAIGGINVTALSNGAAHTSSGNRPGSVFVKNESSAGQLGLARTSLSFTQTNNDSRTHGRDSNTQYVRTNVDNNTATNGLEVVMVGEAYSEGADESRTVVRGRIENGTRIGRSNAVRSGSAGTIGGYALGGQVTVLGGNW